MVMNERTSWRMCYSCSIARRILAGLFLLGFILVGSSTSAVAGMPAVLPQDVVKILRLNDEPIVRIQVISFFLLTLFLSALVVKLLWNGLQSEFARLPRLSYGKSLLFTITWGVLFCIVLVMISGARELMTPGAWERNGSIYRLVEDSSPDAIHDTRVVPEGQQ
jgi:hypothetical protein